MIADGKPTATDTAARPRRARKGLALGGAALAAALVLGGCSIGSPSEVAVVDGTSITKTQLDNSEAGAKAVGQQFSNDQLVSVLIQGAVATDVATKQGIQITDSDRDSQLNPSVLSVPAAHDLAYSLADIQIVSKAVGEDGFKKALASADVKLNPRYGTWDPKQALAVIPGTGSLSQAS